MKQISFLKIFLGKNGILFDNLMKVLLKYARNKSMTEKSTKTMKCMCSFRFCCMVILIIHV